MGLPTWKLKTPIKAWFIYKVILFLKTLEYVDNNLLPQAILENLHVKVSYDSRHPLKLDWLAKLSSFKKLFNVLITIYLLQAILNTCMLGFQLAWFGL
jgi:hypothetical protein